MKQILSACIFFLVSGCAAAPAVQDSQPEISVRAAALSVQITEVRYLSYSNRKLSLVLVARAENRSSLALTIDNAYSTVTVLDQTITDSTGAENIVLAPGRSFSKEFPFEINMNEFYETSRTSFASAESEAVFEYRNTGGNVNTLRADRKFDLPMLDISCRISNFAVNAPPRDKIMSALEASGKNPLDSVSILSIFAGKYNERGLSMLGSVNFDFTISYDILIENRHATEIVLGDTEYSVSIEETALSSGTIAPQKMTQGRYKATIVEKFNTREFDPAILTAYTADSPNYSLRISTLLSTGTQGINTAIRADIKGGGILDK